MTDTATPATTTTATATPRALTTTSSVKPAYKTTEAWFLFATGVLGALGTAKLIGPDTQLFQLCSLVLTLVSAAVHSWSRTSIKNAAAGQS